MEKIIEIPEGYEARIDGNKIILEPKESEDERIRKELFDIFKTKNQSFFDELTNYTTSLKIEDVIAWLEKQKPIITDDERDFSNKIRNEIIIFIKSMKPDYKNWKDYSSWIDWLEKQKHEEGIAIEGQVRDHNFIDFDSSGTSFMIPVPNHNLKCGDKVLVKILKLE